MMVKKLRWYGHISRSSGMAKIFFCRGHWKEQGEEDRRRDGKITSMNGREWGLEIPWGRGFISDRTTTGPQDQHRCCLTGHFSTCAGLYIICLLWTQKSVGLEDQPRAPDKLLFGVKYSIILSKNQLSFKRWGTITQLIDRVPYLFLTSGENFKTFSVRKACRSLISEIKGVLYALT